LIEIEKLRRQAGKSMKDYPQIEMPSAEMKIVIKSLSVE
jgi:hypothetical protein